MTPADQLTAAADLDVDPPRVTDVPGSLAAIHRVGEYLEAHADALEPFAYTTHPRNDNGVHNHFQGLQRLSDGLHFAISGGNWRPSPSGAELFIARMGSRPKRGPWSSNLTQGGTPPSADRVVSAITVDDDLWHSGGMDVLGPVLAIAVEHNDMSEDLARLTGVGRPTRADESAICFFDVSDPADPKFFKGSDRRIVRPGFKAGAVALTRLPNDHYLCGAWSDSDAGPVRLDLYLSESPTFDGRFRQSRDAVRTWVPSDLGVPAMQFQAVNFVHDTDGVLYLLGFAKDDNGSDRVEAYSVHIPGWSEPPEPGAGISSAFELRKVPRQPKFHCPTRRCDMRGASGAFVSDGELIVYSGAQYRGRSEDDPIRIAEFRSPLRALRSPTLRTSWVELYSRAHHRGERLTLRNLDSHGTVEDYKTLRVGARHFGDRARSARYQIPVGYRLTLFRDDGFRNPIIRLPGTGRVEVETDFAALGGQVSSSRLERDV